MHNTFETQKQRLAEVRIKKAKAKAVKLEGPIDDSLDNIDIMSDTSSMATTFISGSTASRSSVMSTSTARSARQRRKMERKKASGKVSAFEDEYLLKSLRKLVEKSNIMRCKFNPGV